MSDSKVVFTADGDLTDDAGTYFLSRQHARLAIELLRKGCPAAEFLALSHDERIQEVAASLTVAQGMDQYSGFLIFLVDRESFAFDVAHALAHFMAQLFHAELS